ncbi:MULTISPECIES: rpa-associated protein [Haloferax]|uniref:Rpa-associated protein n=2 Tax=Haloferax TaxID=2251 RepID=A0A6G1Z4A0_9EURY|nr:MULTISPECIES: rpa-associated protein [Haloferax]KAB1188604.1 rpa-associated protein [Haloferax sp. CBA1149]MRW81305.1 rpa-associated protein [Haloferax marinisediminis]
MSSSPVVGTREVAYRVFAAEFDDASLSYSESDEERAPNYVVTPTGARLNRTFVAGALTEVEHVNDEVLRGRIADPTGAFVTYAGQYQPDPMAFLDQATPPAFVALAGKARTYQPDDSDVVYTSIRPESINTIDADVRDRWLVSTAEATLERIAVFDEALSMPQRGDELRRVLEARGVESTLAAGIPRAIDHYGTTRAYLEAVRTLAVEALELVAGERDQVEDLAVSPGDEGDVTLGSLPELDLLPADSVDIGPAPEETVTAAEESDDAAVSESVEAESETAEPETADSVEAEPETADSVEAEAEASEAEASEAAEIEADAEPVAAEATTAGTAEAEPVSETTADSEPVTAETESVSTEPDAASATPDPEPESEPSDTSSTGGSLGDFEDDVVADDDPLDEPSLDELGDFDDDLPDIEEADVETDPVSETEDSTAEAAADTESVDDTTADSATEATDPSAMYELDDDERAEIESEFGTEFTSGSDVDPAGEADIDVPDVEELSEQVEDEPEPAADPEPVSEPVETESEPTDAEPESDDDTPAEDVNLEVAVVEAMEDIDDGDGAAHDDVVAAVVDEYGVDPGSVEDAIQDALLGGRCYEPQDDVLKAI